jgi:ferrochelatase
MPEIGIIVAQMGGPATQEAVEPFIRSIFEDPDLVPLPGGPAVSKAFGWAVAKARGPFARRNYRLIGGGSPILDITEAQAQALRDELAVRGHDVPVAVAMRYTEPDTADAVHRLLMAGVDRIVLLPLYPQYSFATTGSSEAELRRTVDRIAPGTDVAVIRTWHDHPAYLALQATLVTEALDGAPDGTPVLFSAHGLPVRVVDRGDPYPDETRRTVDTLTAMLGDVDTHLGYQSRTKPVKWIGPGTEDVLADLAESGHTGVVMVPLSFVSDHIETLYEIDILFRDKASELGITDYRRSAVMNDRPEVGPMLADIVEVAL